MTPTAASIVERSRSPAASEAHDLTGVERRHAELRPQESFLRQPREFRPVHPAQIAVVLHAYQLEASLHVAGGEIRHLGLVRRYVGTRLEPVAASRNGSAPAGCPASADASNSLRFSGFHGGVFHSRPQRDEHFIFVVVRVGRVGYLLRLTEEEDGVDIEEYSNNYNSNIRFI